MGSSAKCIKLNFGYKKNESLPTYDNISLPDRPQYDFQTNGVHDGKQLGILIL